ncbi:MAG: L-methionine/branched-chain amino acid exporter YjeH [Candidatus Celerinatantimonas neptuna]|nr:MAG: L-methionine/branched-chain amino acid exporter YjeH [Candidatus Celerinatantimonas neptuna]
MSRLKPQLGIVQGIGLLATTMLGTGIFIVPSITALHTGKSSLLAWILLLFMSLPIAFTFAALGQRYPHAGGAPHLIGQAFGKTSERLSAFLFFAILPVGMPASLIIGSGFIQAIIPLTPFANLAIQLAMLVAMFGLGIAGTKSSGLIQTLIAALIILLICLLWWLSDLHSIDIAIPFSVSGPSFFNALGLMFWCVIGIEAFAHMGEEFRNPKRDYPLALILGTLLTFTIYWATSVVVLKHLPEIATLPSSGSLPAITTVHLGRTTGLLVTILGFLSCFASTNVYIQGYTRLIWSMADEKKLPHCLGRLTPQKIPLNALIAITSVSMFLTIVVWALNQPLTDLLLYTNGNFILIYMLSMLAGVILLKGYQRIIAITGVIITLIFFLSLGKANAYALILCICFFLFWGLRYVSRNWPRYRKTTKTHSSSYPS